VTPTVHFVGHFLVGPLLVGYFMICFFPLVPDMC